MNARPFFEFMFRSKKNKDQVTLNISLNNKQCLLLFVSNKYRTELLPQKSFDSQLHTYKHVGDPSSWGEDSLLPWHVFALGFLYNPHWRDSRK